MLDPRVIRDHYELVKTGLDNRNYPPQYLDRYVSLDTQWRAALQQVEQLKNQQNQLTPKGKPTPEQLAQLKTLSDTIKQQSDALQPLEFQVKEAALQLPNLPLESVPIGHSEQNNVVVKTIGEPPTFTFTPLSHDKIGEKWGVMSFEGAVKIAGSRFVVYRKWGAKLERALIQLMLDMHTTQHGYEEILPPVLVNSKSLQGTGQLPKFSTECFRIADSDLWLSPTSEVQLTNLYADQIIPESDLPIKLTAFTPCFRSEAGSYGKDTAGLIRLHQFHKVELVQLVHPSQSEQALETLCQNAQAVLQALKLPYRVLALCTGDMGFSSAKTYDLEVWMPAQNTYREISSCSNFLDFQSRRAMIRYKSAETNKVGYLHTLNGSGVAIGRAVAAILENYQLEDGRVRVPDVLIPYLGMESLS